MNGLLKLYCDYHPDFLDTLNPFDEKIKQRVINNLQNADNKPKFLSIIAEIQFGLKFQDIGFGLDYEKRYSNKKTPDWTISIDNSYAICEVYRLGKSNKDQKRSDFENLLIEKIHELPFNYFIRIKFIEEYFETEKYDINEIIKDLIKWLNDSERVLGEKILIQENFSFEIAKTNTKINHICCSGNPSSIDFKPDKLIQFDYLKRNNEITKKISKYNSLIHELELPYFIAVSVDFISGFDYDDFKEYFLGKGVEFIDFDTDIANKHFNHLGQNWNELGVFYNTPNLSGLIIYEGNRFKLLLNPIKSQIIYRKENLILLEKIKQIDK